MSERKPKFKTYMFHTKENNKAYKVLAARDWFDGDKIVLPPIRVRSTNSRIYGNKYIVYLYRTPVIYGDSGYLDKKTYLVKVKNKNKRIWKLIPIN